jgi:6,7-dimethyl-8-ribityllumazine synthase
MTDSQQPSILIVESRFYEDLADELVKGAVAELEESGCSYARVAVPGALEIPQAIALALHARAPFRGAVALGCVIRGETSHYDIVAGESARALMDIAIKERFPVGNGILTVENLEQAWERASLGGGAKGRDAARACLELIEAGSWFGSLG